MAKFEVIMIELAYVILLGGIMLMLMSISWNLVDIRDELRKANRQNGSI